MFLAALNYQIENPRFIILAKWCIYIYKKVIKIRKPTVLFFFSRKVFLKPESKATLLLCCCNPSSLVLCWDGEAHANVRARQSLLCPHLWSTEGNLQESLQPSFLALKASHNKEMGLQRTLASISIDKEHNHKLFKAFRQDQEFCFGLRGDSCVSLYRL